MNAEKLWKKLGLILMIMTSFRDGAGNKSPALVITLSTLDDWMIYIADL